MKSRLVEVQNALLSCISEMSTSAGYNYNFGTYQQLDFNKVDKWPLYNVFLSPDERSLDTASFPGMQSFRQVTNFEIHCFYRLTEELSNNQFDVDSTLSYLLHDVKKMIGNNPTLKGKVEYLGYISSKREMSGLSDDIFIPKYLIVNIEVMYSEDSLNPDQIGCN